LILQTGGAPPCPGPAPPPWYALFMENLPKKKRGRPRKIPESPLGEIEQKLRQLPKEARQLVGVEIPTERTAANRFYADRAREAVGGLSESLRIPEDPVGAAKFRAGMDWVLKRTTVLTELGRLMVEDPNQRDIERFQSVLRYIAGRRPKITARQAAAYARRQRLGETRRKERIESLHHALNAAINQHRQRFPESSWADVQRALEYTAGQVARKL
jgi:hypothetical protein